MSSLDMSFADGDPGKAILEIALKEINMLPASDERLDKKSLT